MVKFTFVMRRGGEWAQRPNITRRNNFNRLTDKSIHNIDIAGRGASVHTAETKPRGE